MLLREGDGVVCESTTSSGVMGRPPCCDKSIVKKGPWTEEEDLKLIAYTNSHGTGNWTSVPKKAGLKRCGKSCRLRWTNYLRPNLKHESFTPQEEDMIITLHATIGSRWSAIAHHLPGRTDNDIKNYWNTKLSKKLVQMGIDPITHHPISQVRESIANIQKQAQQIHHTTLLISPHATAAGAGRSNMISCLNRNLKSMFLSSNNSTTLVDQHPFVGIAAAMGAASSSNEAGASSSSSTAATAHRRIDVSQDILPSLDLDWTDFIVDDVSNIPDDRSSCIVGASNEVKAASVASEGSVPMMAGLEFTTSTTTERRGGVEDMSSIFGAVPCSTHDSSTAAFIDAILDQQKEMLSDFPEFLDDSYY